MMTWDGDALTASQQRQHVLLVEDAADNRHGQLYAGSHRTINNGSLSQAAISVQGGTLSGTGTINGNVTVGSGASDLQAILGAR